MITIVISVLFGGGIFSGSYFAGDVSLGWSIFFGIVGFAVAQAVFGVLIQRRVKREMERVQAIMVNGQKQLQAKVQRWQIRPPSSMQSAQRELAADTKVFVREALAATEVLSKYRLWVPLIERQKATAQMQLHWMIQEYDKVDALMPKALFLDPTTVAMKMVRMHLKDEPTEKIEKIYLKGVRRLRYNQNVLLAALWSWILVKRNAVDAAFQALTEALKNSDNEVLKANHEALMNNHVVNFSNSRLGDQWYSLGLEQPKMHAPRQRSVYR